MQTAVRLDGVRAGLAAAATELMVDRAPTQPFGVYVCRFDEPGAELGRFVERGVFLEVFGNTPEQLSKEYDRYEPGSVFIVVLDHARRVPAGMMRVLVPTPARFKSLDDMRDGWGADPVEVLARVDDEWDLERVWDLATLAVSPEYRGNAALGLVTQGLLQTLTMLGSGWGVERYVAILDLPVFRMLQWRIGRPFDAFPGVDAREYLGSAASLPIWGSRRAWADRLAATDPIVYQLFFEGRGLEPVISTPRWDDAVGLVESIASVRIGCRSQAETGTVSRSSAANSPSSGTGREYR
jgi:hypothetical protein